MTSKEYLHQLKSLNDLVSACQDEIDTLRALATRITSAPKEVSVMESHDKSKIEKIMPKLLELEADMNYYIDSLIDLKAEAQRYIMLVRPIKLQTVLIKYYMQNKTFEKTAVEMGKSYQWVCELHGRALQAFEKNFKKSEILDRT